MLHSEQQHHDGPLLQTPSARFPRQPGLDRAEAVRTADPAAALRGGLLHPARGMSTSPPPDTRGAVPSARTRVPGLPHPGAAAPHIRRGQISAHVRGDHDGGEYRRSELGGQTHDLARI